MACSMHRSGGGVPQGLPNATGTLLTLDCVSGIIRTSLSPIWPVPSHIPMYTWSSKPVPKVLAGPQSRYTFKVTK